MTSSIRLRCSGVLLANSTPMPNSGCMTRILPSVLTLQSATHKNSSTLVSIGKGESVRRKHPPELMSVMMQRIGGSAFSPDFMRSHSFRLPRAPSESFVNRTPARAWPSELCQAIKPVASIWVVAPGGVKHKPTMPEFLHGRLDSSEIPPSLKPEMKACSPSPFWNLRETGMRTGTRRDRRRSRFMRALAARKLDLARSQEIGL